MSAVLAWAAALLGFASTYVVLLANGMSAAPKRLGFAGVFALALLPLSGAALSGYGLLESIGAGSVLTALAVFLPPLGVSGLVIHWLGYEARHAWRRGRPTPPPEREYFTRNPRGPGLRFALCRAETEPVAGWTPMSSDRLQGGIWVEPVPLLDNSDLQVTWSCGPGHGDCYLVGLRLTDAAWTRIREHAAVGQLAVLIDEQLLVAPRYFGELGPDLEFSGVFDRDSARRIARGII